MLSEELKKDLEKVQEMREKRQMEKFQEKSQDLETVDKIIGYFGGSLLLVMVSITLFYWFQN